MAKFQNVNGRRYYEENEKQWLRENYPVLGVKETTRQFNEKFDHNKNEIAIKRYCRHHLGVGVPKERRYATRTSPIGYTYKNCRGEWKVKTENGWIPLSHLHKEVPKGSVAIHLDRDADNNDPENIVIVKNGIQTVLRNSGLWSEDPQITSVAITWAELYQLMRKELKDGE